MKKNLLLMFFLGMGMILFVSSGFSQSFVDQHGQLRVSGNRIVDKNGSPIALRGMSLYWSQWKPAFYNASCIKWLRDDWKCTVIRAAMAVGSGGYLTNPTVEKDKVKAVVQACIDNGIYAIIDWHSLDGNEANVGAAKAFFAEMAQIYGSYPNVLYELWNEPTAVSWSGVVKPYHLSVIASIRPLDPDNIIICGTDQWDQHPNLAAADPITTYSNIAYSLHFYAATHKQWLRDNAQIALNLGAALFVTEWGTSEATGNGVFDSAETQIWWNFLDQNYIGQCNWSVADLGETSAALYTGASGTGGWTDANLKPSGQLVRSYLIGKSVSDPTAAPTTVPTSAPTAVVTTAPTTVPGTRGDVNNSGSVDIVDALLIAQYYVGLNPANFNSSLADVNCSGGIDIVDALLIAQRYVGLITSFPC